MGERLGIKNNQAISIKDLSFQYKDDKNKKAIENITLDVDCRSGRSQK